MAKKTLVGDAMEATTNLEDDEGSSSNRKFEVQPPVFYRDWAELPPELLGSIAERLPPLDFISFGAVCTSWNSTASVHNSLYLPLPPDRQIPLLLFPEQNRLLSLAEKHWRPIAGIPEMEGKWCIGSQFGWLALIDATSGEDPSLLNPLTRAHVHLPSKSFVTDHRGIHPRIISTHVFKKIVLSSAAEAASGYTAVAITGRHRHLGFLKEGQDRWTILDGVDFVADVIYRDRNFLAITYYGKVTAIDLTGPSPLITDSTFNLQRLLHPGGDNYLVESYGDLLQLTIHYSGVSKFTIEVRKFEPELAEWIPLEGLADRSIFVGLSHSISVSTLEDSRLRPNCVYFTERVGNWLGCDKFQRHKTRQVLRAVDLEDGRLESYYPPRRRMRCPPPVWFTPSLI